jgi:hypothetical protein
LIASAPGLTWIAVWSVAAWEKAVWPETNSNAQM